MSRHFPCCGTDGAAGRGGTAREAAPAGGGEKAPRRVCCTGSGGETLTHVINRRMICSRDPPSHLRKLERFRVLTCIIFDQVRVLEHRELLARQERSRQTALAEARREALAEAEAAAARAGESADRLEEEASTHERAAAEARRRCDDLQRRAVVALQEKVLRYAF